MISGRFWGCDRDINFGTMMKELLVLCAAIIASAQSSGEFTVLHHPNSVLLKGHDHIKESTLPELYSAVLGFSTEHYSNWEGLYIVDPFDLAEAVATVFVDGVSDIGQQKGHHFPLRTNDDDARIFQTLERRVQARYPESEAELVGVSLADGLTDMDKHAIFRGIKSDKPRKANYNFLKTNVDEDREFLREITLLNSIADKISRVQKDNIPDIYWFRVSALHPLVDLYGENSTQTKEAKRILNEAILHLNNAFTKAYGGSVFVNVITSDASHTRRARSVLAAEDAAKADEVIDYGLADDYADEYPVIFNIMLWFGVTMVFSLLAACLVIADMDPGRDSIIYRMTSTRMKKD